MTGLRVALGMCVLLVACSDSGNHRSAIAVGVEQSGRDCTYEADPKVATISDDKTSAMPIGPGMLTSICGGHRVEWDVVKATSLRITGGGADAYLVSPYAGNRDLGQHSCDARIALAPECDGIAQIENKADHGMGAAAFGGSGCGSGIRVVRVGAGTCTLVANDLGLTASAPITFK